MTNYMDKILAHYEFKNGENDFSDSSCNHFDGVIGGTNPPTIQEIEGRKCAVFEGGDHGTNFIKLPENLLSDVSDNTGFTVSTWVYYKKGGNTWERIFDFGKSQNGPYSFMTRGFRSVCFKDAELAADPGKSVPLGEWVHVAISVSGTKQGTMSSAGPVVYVNGELASDGRISQTTSGSYKQLREFFACFDDKEAFVENMIGSSKFAVDPDFSGAISDFRVFKTALSQDEIIDMMCETLSDENIIALARDKYLNPTPKIIQSDISLCTSLVSDKVKVDWVSSKEDVISSDGKVKDVKEADSVTFTAKLSIGDKVMEKSFESTVVPADIAPYEITISNEKVVDVSETLFGLFYEDINNAADGGIYAELIKNRSFEDFTFNTYDPSSGENGKSTGRNHTPLNGWYGDLDKATPQNTEGLNAFFELEDPDASAYYVTVDNGTLYNRGFNDTNNGCELYQKAGVTYDFTIWAKSKNGGKISVTLLDENKKANSDTVVIEVLANSNWNKYGKNGEYKFVAKDTLKGQIEVKIQGEVSIDMVSLMPGDVWGAKEEKTSKTAHKNFLGNPNYRLRRDLVVALKEVGASFLRFPGGCISEGSYIWDNVYDWKDSVDIVEKRKENYNVWGYNMTMGLGYMEYFQLAEDLGCTPLPVMACGVLCQARSDYANPAGGALQEKYINNFIDLVDFAISTDFANNKWAKLRKDMGHEAPFDLHLLGVGNENWGPEFMASFEAFYDRIMEHVHKTYPGYDFTIVSTVGAQADDDAYQTGWKFLAGRNTGKEVVAFTDGQKSVEKEVTWYNKKKDYMDTIADEHYYRPNNYLLNNCDRYNYYLRAYNVDGTLNEDKTSKVFIGEYASTDKNTLMGAICEGAIMTSYENNSDVVRLASTAPLFNKVLTDGQYRWTPDCIWFDNEKVWRTPTYYVQQLFATYLGKETLRTSYESYVKGKKQQLMAKGGIEIAAGKADILVKSVTVTSNVDGKVLYEEDFTNEDKISEEFSVIEGSHVELKAGQGLVIKGSSTTSGIYMYKPQWSNYTVKVKEARLSGDDGLYVGVGLTEIAPEKKNVIEYAIDMDKEITGPKVFKNGVEAYKLGDFASSKVAGNMRYANNKPLTDNEVYEVTVNYGGEDAKHLIMSYEGGANDGYTLEFNLEPYNFELYTSVTRDEKHVYVKVVNPDLFSKKTKINVEDLKVAKKAKMITLASEAPELISANNVNEKEVERVVPTEKVVEFSEKTATFDLNACSLTVLIFDRQ